MKYFALTLDYELYGNGMGDVFQHIIEPTNRLLSIAQERNLRYTFFVEMVEILQLRKMWDSGEKMGYLMNPVEAMEHQLQQAYLNGHDVQLHIHPQWMNAEYIGGKWKVDKSEWRLGGFRNGSLTAMYDMLLACKTELEAIIKSVDPNYRCIAIRAGGYNAMPSEVLVEVMRRLNLRIDSSVVPGAAEDGELSVYDYSQSPNDRGYWMVEKELDVPSKGPEYIIELPIFACPIRRIVKYFDLERVAALLRNKKAATEMFEAKAGGKNTSFFQKLGWFFQTEYQTWDFCLFSKGMHRRFLKAATMQMKRDCFTLVGHPKSLVSTDGFLALISLLGPNVAYITVSDFIAEKIIK